MSLDVSALKKNLCFWCDFQSSLSFIISLLLENVLTALCIQKTRRYGASVHFGVVVVELIVNAEE